MQLLLLFRKYHSHLLLTTLVAATRHAITGRLTLDRTVRETRHLSSCYSRSRTKVFCNAGALLTW